MSHSAGTAADRISSEISSQSSAIRSWSRPLRIAAGFATGCSLALLGASGTSLAQTSGPIAPRAGQQVQRPVENPQNAPNIRIGVNLVNAPAIVRDSKGQLLLDLTQANFRVFDNGAEQRIEAFDVGGAPLSVALVIETSSRVTSLLPAVRRTGTTFTQTVLGENGDAAVIGYNDEVNTLAEFTANPDVIEKAIGTLQNGTSGARLYDAMERAVQMLRTRSDTRRRVLITMAEAVDTGSEERLGNVLRQAALANITIYPIGLSTAASEIKGEPRVRAPVSATPPGTFGLPPMPGTPQTPSTEDIRAGTGASNMDLTALAALIVQHVRQKVERPLEVAALATGGLYQSTGLRDSGIPAALDEISGELHAQYMLSYRPSGTGAGDYHQIKVEVVGRRGVKVRSRLGYYLGSDQG